jgi:hypothetical protein
VGGGRAGAKDLARRFAALEVAAKSFAVCAVGAIATRSFAVYAAQDKVKQ